MSAEESDYPDYEILGKIGNGSFGAVYKVLKKSKQKVMVFKELSYGKMSEKEKKQLVSEVNILRDVQDQYIVKYHDRIINKKQ